jgi:hypothetical protein
MRTRIAVAVTSATTFLIMASPILAVFPMPRIRF